METWLLQILRRHGLPEPVLQFTVVDEFGNFVARTDAAIPQWRITIEYQSMQEHSDEFQSARDDHRRNKIIRAGFLCRFTRDTATFAQEAPNSSPTSAPRREPGRSDQPASEMRGTRPFGPQVAVGVSRASPRGRR
jgi:hypothetical protein